MNEEERFDFEQKHEEDLQRLRGFRLLDDDFMSKVFEDKNCVEFLLQIILKRDDLKVTSVSSQYVIKNLQGRSVRLDILAVDRQNQVYNIEIQRDDKGAGVKRARYNSSLIDANVTEPGEQYQNLNETYVVFITENDVLGENIPIYHVDRIVRETGKMFNDQSHIIYVNSQIKDETALGKLMHDFTCTNAKDMYYEVLADRVHYFKEDEKGVAIMCKAMEDMRNEAAREAEKMKAMMSYIQDHYTEMIAVDCLAREAHISKRVCFRLFQENLHMSPLEYMREYRLRKACMELIETEKSITEIASDCGFGSSSYFGKLFREHFNCSPVRYRGKWHDCNRNRHE